MAENKKYQFIMSDESVVNCYGFRVLTAGIDTETAFAKNPVGFWNHKANDTWKETDDMPICKWLSWEKKEGKLIGWLEVDTDDERGKRLASKIEKGYVNAVSIYFDPVEISESPEHLLIGQTRPTITRSILLECSPVGLPGNYNAVRLKLKDGGCIALNAASTANDIDSAIPRINMSIKNSNMTPEQKALLGLSADATDQQVTEALTALKNKSAAPAAAPAAQAAAPEGEDADAKELIALRKERVTTLVNQGIADRKFTEAERETYESLALKDFDGTKKAIASMQPAVKLSSLLQPGTTHSQGATKVEDCEFYKLSKGNTRELSRIQAEEPDRFKAIHDEYVNLVKNN